jgi:hypothetical protein
MKNSIFLQVSAAGLALMTVCASLALADDNPLSASPAQQNDVSGTSASSAAVGTATVQSAASAPQTQATAPSANSSDSGQADKASDVNKEAVSKAQRTSSDKQLSLWRRRRFNASLNGTAPTQPAAVLETPTNPDAQATSAATQAGAPAAGTPQLTAGTPTLDTSAATEKVLVKPGQEISIGTDADALVITDDVNLAKAQAAKYPNDPEAHFILAVALTKTSYVEEALKEVRFARRLAQTQGGAAYFDKMITQDENILINSPKDNRVRYSLAWAYYMKAYLIGQDSRRKIKMMQQAGLLPQSPQASLPIPAVAQQLAQSIGVAAPSKMAPIQGAIDGIDPKDAPLVKKYFEQALKNLDQLLAQEPGDVWARVYRAHLKAEYTGNLDEAMKTWHVCQQQAPDNPAPYFFLGEGYLKQGNLKECLNNVSRAVALRAMGK